MKSETIVYVCKAVELVTKQFMIIDGNSTDNTRRIIADNGWKLVIQKGSGKGAALRQAIEESTSSILVFIDADGSHECSDIPKLVDPIVNNKADMVVASRYLGGSDELHGTWNNFIRMVGSSLITLGINYRWKTNLTDVENGFRAIKREVALKLDLKAKDFTIEQEMVLKAAKKGYRIKEVASHEYERKGGVSKLPTSQGWKFIWEFMRDIL